MKPKVYSHRKVLNPAQAKEDPTFNMGDEKFGMIDAQAARTDAARKAGDANPKQQSKYAQAHIKQSFMLVHAFVSRLEHAGTINQSTFFLQSEPFILVRPGSPKKP